MNIKEVKRAKIVATIGSATRDLKTMEKLFINGVNMVRMNFSHSTHDEHKLTYDNARAIAKKYNAPLAVLADMQGPKLRVGKFADGKVYLEKGQKFTLDMKDEPGDSSRAYLPHPQIFEAIKDGDILLIDDGKIKLEVQRFGRDYLEAKVLVPGFISDAKGVNFPSGILKLSSLTEKDFKDLEFALSLGVDYIGLSFVQLPRDVEYAKNIIKGRAKVVAKIEKPSAVEHIKEIIEVSDVIMVARGDLGVELPVHMVPEIQKEVIRECRRQHKPVIVATQMLESMINSPVPTRAEVSDVANAMYDGADAVMLSGETAMGDFPVETVAMMTSIVKSVEEDHLYWEMLYSSYNHIHDKYSSINPGKDVITTGRAISIAAKQIADIIDVKIIIAFSSKGTTLNRISHQRPKAKILGLTDSPALYNQMALNWGVTPLFVDRVSSFSEIVELSSSWLQNAGWAKKGDKILVIAGVPVGIGGITNSIRVVELD